MEKWKEYRLGEVGRIITGKTPRTAIKDNYGGTVPFLTPSDDMACKFVSHTNKTLTPLGLAEVKNCLLPENSICVSCIGSDLGKVVKTQEPSVTNQQINSIIPYKDFDADFVYYLMCIVGKDLNFISKTSTAVPIVNKSTFSNYKVRIPQIGVQKAIGNILSSLDDKIELNRKINSNLEEQAKALFKSWFIDFEPFKGGKFVDSELGKIPEGWKVVFLSDIANFISGYSYKGNELVPSKQAMATIKNFQRKGGFKLDGFKEIIPSDKIKKEQYANIYDILVAHTDLTQNADVIGNAEMLLSNGDYEKIIFSMDLVKVEPKEVFPYRFFIASLLQSEKFKSYCLGYVNGTTVLHLSKKALPNYILAIPHNNAYIVQFDNLLSNLYKKMSELIKENSKLSLLRDSLLPRLMSGEIEV